MTPEVAAILKKMQEEQIIAPAPTAGPSFRGRPTRPDGITEGTVDLPYNEEDILPPDTPVSQQITGTTAALTPTAPVAPAAKAEPSKPTDPYSSLSKTQKRMLAFAAIADAGMALQGKEGTKVASLLGDFTKRADQARKERQAEASAAAEAERRAFLMGLLPSANIVQTSGASGELPSAAQLEAQIQALTGQLGAFASLDQLDVFNSQMTVLQSQLEAAKSREAAEAETAKIETGKLNQAQDALVYAERALQASTGLSGDEFTKFLEQAKTGDADLDASAFLLARQSFIPDAISPAFMDFQAAISTLSSIMTFQNMAEVTEAGAKLGILSDADMRILGNMSGELDPVNRPVQTAQTVMDLYGKLNRTIAKLKETDGDAGELERLRKKYEM